ncbi:hypothetical protein [Tabrizicola sp.]|uniref:hypothetical protein n=1 Tax=Tabrizicola sp. TaxID=2005166 RepID=UPI0035AED323
MKTLLRPSHQGRSGYISLVLFALAYTATLALVIAPDQVKFALDATWIPTFD